MNCTHMTVAMIQVLQYDKMYVFRVRSFCVVKHCQFWCSNTA